MCAEPSAFIRAEPMRIDGINASLPTGYNKKKWKQHISVNKRRKNWNTTQHVLPQFHPFHHLVSMTHASLLAEDDVYFWTSNIVEFANNWIMNNSLAPNARTQQYLVAAMPLALLDLSTWNTCGWPLDTFNGCEAVIMSITYSSRALTHRSIDAQTKQHQYEHTQRVTRTRVYSANDAPHVGWPRIQRIYSHTLIETKKNKHHLRLFNSIFDHCFHFCFFIPAFFFLRMWERHDHDKTGWVMSYIYFWSYDFHSMNMQSLLFIWSTRLEEGHVASSYCYKWRC